MTQRLRTNMTIQTQDTTFPIFGGPQPGKNSNLLPDPPPWRQFTDESAYSRKAPDLSDRDTKRAAAFYYWGRLSSDRINSPDASVAVSADTDLPQQQDIRLTVSAALALRRPLLVLGNPGTGKSSIAYAIAHDLGLGAVLRWNINSRSFLRDGLFTYDAIGRLNEASLIGTTDNNKSIPDIGKFITLGPLGTALVPTPRKKPRVLLIDELDKSDIDLPNDLLNVFEEGAFDIAELVRDKIEVTRVRPVDAQHDDDLVTIKRGHVQCTEFPIVVITSNGEREFSPAFLRRCIRLRIANPDATYLAQIASQYLQQLSVAEIKTLVSDYIKDNPPGYVATDQFLNALFLLTGDGVASRIHSDQRKTLQTILLEAISPVAGGSI